VALGLVGGVVWNYATEGRQKQFIKSAFRQYLSAEVIENMLAKVDCPKAISDQFGNKNIVLKALMERGRKIELVQRHRAESDLAVAAASILAREEFVSRLGRLGKEFGIKLPKGASDAVIEARGLGRLVANREWAKLNSASGATGCPDPAGTLTELIR
jgi:ribonuclease HIII